MKTWTLIATFLLVVLSMEVMADDPTPTAREAELEAELAECQAEVQRLKAPPTPPAEAELLQRIDELQQRINEAQ